MMGADSDTIASVNEQIEVIEKLNVADSSKSVVETGRRRAATGTNQITISPNSAVGNAGEIPVVIKSDKPFLNPVTPTNVGSFELEHVIKGDDNTIYGVLNTGSLAQGAHDLTVHNGGNTLTLSDAFTVTTSVTPKPYLAMVYMACDNNLTGSCEQLFNKLELAAANADADPDSDIRIVAFWDGKVHGDSAYYLIQPDNNPYARATYDENSYVSLGEVDSADPSTLVQFAAWAKSQYPDTFSFLSLVDHGNGWAPDLYPGQPRGYRLDRGADDLFLNDTSSNRPITSNVGGLFWDDTSGNVMPTKVLADALEWITQGNENKFDVIYIDACQMATVEVMAELSPYADYIIAHENWTWARYPYDKYFDGVNISTSPYQLATQIAEAYRDTLPGYGHPFQISVIDTSQMSNVLTELEDFTNALRSNWSTRTDDIQEAVLKTAHVDENVDVVLDSQDSTIDLYDFASQIIAQANQPSSNIPDSVKNAAQDLMGAIKDDSNKAVEHNHTSPNPSSPFPGSPEWDMTNFNGLSIYFPLADEWKRGFYGPYALPNFASNSTWDEFIQEWYSNGQAPVWPTEECDPEECIAAPMHIGLTIDEDDVIRDTGRVVWVPVSLHGADRVDDIRGVQIKVHVSDTAELVPASGLKPRKGNLFPTDAFTNSVRTTEGWAFLLTDVGSTETITGTGQVVQLPFRFLVEESCQELEFSQHIIEDGAPNVINHYHEEKGLKTTICHSEVGPLDSAVKLERRPPNTHDHSEIILVQGVDVYETQSGLNGKYGFNRLPNGDYTISFDNDESDENLDGFFLRYETTVNINGPTTRPEVTLCAGDMDDDDDIDSFDENLLLWSIQPVGMPKYDLNANGKTTVGDLIILQQNLGKVAPNEHCGDTTRRISNEELKSIATNVRRASVRQAKPRFSTPVQANLNAVGTLRAVNIDSGASFEGLGTRIALPTGATVNHLELIGDFANEGAFLEWQQQDNELYIVAAFPAGSPLTADADIVRFEMSVPESGNVEIQGTNPAELDGKLEIILVSETRLYLPLMQR